MDLGFQLGRRFRALKLWMVIRAFGVAGLQERIREHCGLARELANRIEADPRFELAAPAPFSAVCFRARLENGTPEEQDRFNERLLARVNAAGAVLPLAHGAARALHAARGDRQHPHRARAPGRPLEPAGRVPGGSGEGSEEGSEEGRLSEFPFVPYRPPRLSEEEMRERGRRFLEEMEARRSVRFFSPDPVPRELIELAIRTASTAPSGAHRQPWRFVAIADPALQREIRVAAEAEEHESYVGGRMPPEWREALEPLGTSWEKPFLETAPWLVVVFEELYGLRPDGGKRKNYYPKESVGIACGLFIAALHRMGLATLTHTPSPMAFLSRLLGRPANEKPFILFPVGYPAPDAEVPDLRRKSLEEIAVWHLGSGHRNRERLS